MNLKKKKKKKDHINYENGIERQRTTYLIDVKIGQPDPLLAL